MNSHEYAEKLKAAAEFLLSREDTKLTESAGPHLYLYFWEKQSFVDAVRGFGHGKKEYKDGELQFIPEGPCDIFTLGIGRDRVCRLVRPAEYECEPILSDEEVATLGK